MLSRISLLGALLILSALMTHAAGLYVVQVGSPDDLTAIKGIVDYARGMVGDKFIVELERRQLEKLYERGIYPEVILEEYAGEALFWASSQNPNYTFIPDEVRPIYSSGRDHLVSLDKTQLESLREAGYFVLPLTDIQTPIYYAPAIIASPGLSSYPCDTLADLISRDSLVSYISRLQAFQSRSVLNDSLAAAGEWVENKFRSFGYSQVYKDWFTGTDMFTGLPFTAFNVICTKPGLRYPDKFMLVGAHYDSWARNSVDLAPGADDNASGTAAVLELARIFRNVDFEYSITFVAFSAEEAILVGSDSLAQDMRRDNVDLRFMMNLDMLGYNEGALDSLTVASGISHGYGKVMAGASIRISDLKPFWETQINRSGDHWPFYLQGYPVIWMIEYDPHLNPYIHSVHDSLIYLDMDYAQKMTRSCAVTFGIVDRALEPAMIRICDWGDGHSLRFEVQDCQPDYNYHFVYGTNRGGPKGEYQDTAVVNSGLCYYDAADLIPGQMYYAAVMAESPEGYTSLELLEDSLVSQIAPRPPVLTGVDPDSLAIDLTWKANTELDLKYYRLLRKETGGDWQNIFESATDTVYRDEAVLEHTSYSYAVLALDNDFNQSDTSVIISAEPGSFDRTLLLVDEMVADDYIPSEPEQTQYFNQLLEGVNFDKYLIGSVTPTLTRSKAGEYKCIYWADDDNTSHLLSGSLDSLHWFLEFGVNMLLAGWQTVYEITGSSYLYPGSLFYDHFGLSRVQINSMPQFAGADGESDWPGLELKSADPVYGQLGNITIFDPAPYAQVIYRYHSNTPGSYYDNKPAGIAYNTGFGKRVVLGFPLYQLTEASAQALVQNVLAYFAEPTPHYGDINHDGRVNIQDITSLINYLYKGGPAPSVLNDADANGDCRINIQDITYLLRYLYQGGALPIQGCLG